MLAQMDALPRRVPIGTTYVIVGRNGTDGKLHVSSRHLVFPDGREVELPADRSAAVPCRRRSVRTHASVKQARPRPAKKIFTKPGTSARASR
jgi:hypothetical protein